MIWLVAPVLLAMAAWRWGDPTLAMMASTVALITAAGFAASARARRALPWLAAMAAGLGLLRLIGGDAGFPCDIHCDGGGAWSRIFGVDVLIPATVAYAALALASWRCRHLPVSLPTAMLAWSLAGASLAYLGIAWHIDLLCRHCFAVHTVVLVALAGAWPAQRRWLPPLALPLAMLVLAMILPWKTAVDPSTPTTTTLDAQEEAWRSTISAARWDQQGSGPITAELIIDLQCPLCAKQHGVWLNELRQHSELSIVTRLLVRPREPAAKELAQWTMACAAQGKGAFQIALAALLGSPSGASADELRGRLDGLVDFASLEAWLLQHDAAVMAVINDDQRLLHAFKADQRTPTLLLRRDAVELGRVVGNQEIERVRGLLAEVLAKPGP